MAGKATAGGSACFSTCGVKGRGRKPTSHRATGVVAPFFSRFLARELLSPLAVLRSQIDELEGTDKEKLEEFMFNKSRLLGATPLNHQVRRPALPPVGKSSRVSLL